MLICFSYSCWWRSKVHVYFSFICQFVLRVWKAPTNKTTIFTNKDHGTSKSSSQRALDPNNFSCKFCCYPTIKNNATKNKQIESNYMNSIRSWSTSPTLRTLDTRKNSWIIRSRDHIDVRTSNLWKPAASCDQLISYHGNWNQFVIYLFIAEESENQENQIHECILCKPADRSYGAFKTERSEFTPRRRRRRH